jgi:sister-chromatid-cohesion protein PDS5
MAPRRGAEPVQEEPQAPQPGTLTFNEPLSWKAGRPIPTAELLRRLDTLATELREMDQEDVDKESFNDISKSLAAQNLLGHKDKGVRAFTACCLVDVLKICAPDAPFTPTQLKVRASCNWEMQLTLVGHFHFIRDFHSTSSLGPLTRI